MKFEILYQMLLALWKAFEKILKPSEKKAETSKMWLQHWLKLSMKSNVCQILSSLWSWFSSLCCCYLLCTVHSVCFSEWNWREWSPDESRAERRGDHCYRKKWVGKHASPCARSVIYKPRFSGNLISIFRPRVQTYQADSLLGGVKSSGTIENDTMSANKDAEWFV